MIIRAIIVVLVLFSVFQNRNFLLSDHARRPEQDFIIEQFSRLPDNSLLLTISENKYLPSGFKKIPDKRYYLCDMGCEFPVYLLAEKKIDVMDIFTELDPDILKNYNHIYYYRGLYARSDKLKQKITDDFETSFQLTEIDSINIADYNLEAYGLYDLLGSSRQGKNKYFQIGLYKVNIED